jgi:flagellar biosynthesis/type III secretory pathway chaperone
MPNPQLPTVAQANRGARRDIVAALIELLEREQLELTAPRADALEALAQKKQPLLQALQPPARGVRDDAATRTLLARAQRLNLSNASLLAMHRTSCEARLRLLRGARNDGATTLYGANGYLHF